MTPTEQNILGLVLKSCGDLEPALIMGIIEHESSFKAAAFANDKHGGSYGLMQLDMATAMQMGFEGEAWELYDPQVNIPLGIKYLVWIKSDLERHSCYTVESMLAGYNEGVGSVLKGYKDQTYVLAVLAARDRWCHEIGQPVTAAEGA